MANVNQRVNRQSITPDYKDNSYQILSDYFFDVGGEAQNIPVSSLSNVNQIGSISVSQSAPSQSATLAGLANTPSIGSIQTTSSVSIVLSGIVNSSAVGSLQVNTNIVKNTTGYVNSSAIGVITVNSAVNQSMVSYTNQNNVGVLATATSNTVSLSGTTSDNQVGTISSVTANVVSFSSAVNINGIGTITFQQTVPGQIVNLSGFENNSVVGNLSYTTNVASSVLSFANGSIIGQISSQAFATILISGVQNISAINTPIIQTSASSNLIGYENQNVISPIVTQSNIVENTVSVINQSQIGEISYSASNTITLDSFENVSSIGQTNTIIYVTLDGLNNISQIGVINAYDVKGLICEVYSKDRIVNVGSLDRNVKLSTKSIEIEIQERTKATIKLKQKNRIIKIYQEGDSMALVGNTVRLFAEFTTFDGNLADPTDITLIIYDTNTNYEYTDSQIVRQSLGVYYKDFTIPSGRGWLKYTWSGTLEGSTALNQGVIERVSA